MLSYKIIKPEIHYRLRKKSLNKTNNISRLSLFYIISTKQHNDCVFPSILWERISFN